MDRKEEIIIAEIKQNIKKIEMYLLNLGIEMVTLELNHRKKGIPTYYKNRSEEYLLTKLDLYEKEIKRRKGENDGS